MVSGPGGDAVLEKDFTKELGNGKFIDFVEKAHKYPKVPYTPPESLVGRYSSAQLGAGVAYELVSQTEFANAPAAQALCQTVIDRLLAGWNGPKPTVTVRIVADPLYHGEARPSGLMLINIGTFNTEPEFGAITIEELALLLGHELAHMLLGHPGSDKAIHVMARGLTLAANSYMAYATVDKTHMVGNQVQVSGDPRLYRQGLIGSLASQTLIEDLLKPSFGRTKELEADRLGIDLARRAGFKVTATTADDFIGHNRADDARISQQMTALAMVLRAMSAESAARIATNGGMFSDVLRRAAQGVSDAAVDGAVKVVAARAKDHLDPAQRKAFLERYIAVNYPESTAAEPGRLAKHDRSLAATSQTPQVALLLTHVARAEDVKEGIIDLAADPNASAEDAKLKVMMKNAGLAAPPPATSAVASKKSGAKGRKTDAAAPAPTARPSPGFADENAAFTWGMQGVLLAANGNTTAAQEAWRQGLRADPPSIDAVQRWGRGLTMAQRKSELPPTVDRVGKLLGTTDPILDLVVGAATGAGDTAQAELAAARCFSYEAGELYPSCVFFLGYDPLNKATPAQSEEGRKAFAGLSFQKNFQPLINLMGAF